MSVGVTWFPDYGHIVAGIFELAFIFEVIFIFVVVFIFKDVFNFEVIFMLQVVFMLVANFSNILFTTSKMKTDPKSRIAYMLVRVLWGGGPTALS